ncbi:unnamed protein product [Rhodiola kirilowii]
MDLAGGDWSPILRLSCWYVLWRCGEVCQLGFGHYRHNQLSNLGGLWLSIDQAKPSCAG